jgi:hypothetical protein
VLAFVLLPTRIAVKVESGSQGDTEDMGFGLILTPVVLEWGLSALVLSGTQNFESGAKTLLRYLPAFVFMYGLVGLTAWIAIAGGPIWFWWLPFFLILTPVAVATIAATLHLTGKQSILLVLNRRIVYVFTLALFYAVPLLYAASIWYYFAIVL